MSDRWAIRLAVTGDLRFLSHHDMMRVMERIVGRAKLPLRYSQGCNPRPTLSLPCPRPVGITTRDDLLVLALETPMEAEAILSALNAQTPRGLIFRDARRLPEKQTSVQPERVEYEVSLATEQASTVAKRLVDLEAQDTWHIERRGKPSRRRSKQTPRPRSIDIKPMLAGMGLHENRFHFTCVAHEQKWAKPSEILHLAGVSEPEALARVVRTNILADVPSATEPLDGPRATPRRNNTM